MATAGSDIKRLGRYDIVAVLGKGDAGVGNIPSEVYAGMGIMAVGGGLVTMIGSAMRSPAARAAQEVSSATVGSTITWAVHALMMRYFTCQTYPAIDARIAADITDPARRAAVHTSVATDAIPMTKAPAFMPAVCSPLEA